MQGLLENATEHFWRIIGMPGEWWGVGKNEIIEVILVICFVLYRSVKNGHTVEQNNAFQSWHPVLFTT